MHSARTVMARLTMAIIVIMTLGGCSTPMKQALFLFPDFQSAAIRTIDLPPVTFESRYEPSYAVDLDGELRQQLKAILEKKGYGVELTAGGGDSDASLLVHVDFLFISETLSDRQPPPVIDIEAEAHLVSAKGGMELWRDRGGGRVGGSGGSRIVFPAADRSLALSLLADHLLATLPSVADR